MSVKRIILKEEISDIVLGKMKGQFFDDTGYTELNEDCDVEDENGNFICKIRKNVFTSDIIDNYDNVFFPLNDNRGMSSGAIDEELIKKKYKDGKYVKKGKYKYTRINKNNTESKFTLSNPVRSNIVGYFDYINYKTVKGEEKRVGYRNIKITSNTNERSLDTLKPLTKGVDDLYKEIMPIQYYETKKKLQDLGYQEFLYGDCLTSTITINTDFRTGLHKDANNYAKYGMMVVLNNGEEHFKGGELLFPRYKAKCCLTNGDFIMFANGDAYHTNNEIVGGNRWSFVFYIRGNIVKFYEDNTSNIERTYISDLFIDYEKPAIILTEGYNKYKKEIVDYANLKNYPIYRMSNKTSFNQRKFGEGKFRFINKDKMDKFTNPIFLKNILVYCERCKKPILGDIRDGCSKCNNLDELDKKFDKMVITNGLSLIETKEIKNIGKSVKFYVRKNTTDRKAIEEVVERRDYQNKNINFDFDKEDVWLDGGVNIGAFTVLCMNYNVKKVYGYETEKSNYDIANKNIKIQESHTEVKIFNKGLSTKDEELDLYLCNTEYNKYRHSVIKHKTTENRKTVRVQCIDIEKVLSEYSDINSIKLDIEGAEMDIIEKVDFKKYGINKLVFEWSFDFDPSLERFKKMVTKLKEQFNVVHHRKLPSGKLWVHYPMCLNVYCINSI